MRGGAPMQAAPTAPGRAPRGHMDASPAGR